MRTMCGIDDLIAAYQGRGELVSHRLLVDITETIRRIDRRVHRLRAAGPMCRRLRDQPEDAPLSSSPPAAVHIAGIVYSCYLQIY